MRTIAWVAAHALVGAAVGEFMIAQQAVAAIAFLLCAGRDVAGIAEAYADVAAKRRRV